MENVELGDEKHPIDIMLDAISRSDAAGADLETLTRTLRDHALSDIGKHKLSEARQHEILTAISAVHANMQAQIGLAERINRIIRPHPDDKNDPLPQEAGGPCGEEGCAECGGPVE